MNCAFCSSDIDADSFFCDQCGKELFICPTCGKSRKGKNCAEDGSKLYSPRQKTENDNQPGIQNQTDGVKNSQPVVSLFSNTPEIKRSNPNSNISIPVLRLVNNNLKIDIEIEDGDVIGSNKGKHKEIFSQFRKISGSHSKFIYDNLKGWMVIDIGSTGTGSTNGTAVSRVADWQNTPRLIPNQPCILNDNCLLLIANLEFQVKINQTSSPTGTERL